jgi:hypothetical protein
VSDPHGRQPLPPLRYAEGSQAPGSAPQTYSPRLTRLWETCQQVVHGRFVHSERVHKVLSVAPHPQLVAAPLLALGGCQVAGQQVHQRGFA